MLKQRNQSGTGQKTSIVEVLMTPEISMLIVLVILCVYRDMIDFMGRGVIRTEGMVSHHFPLEKIPDVLDMIVNHREKTFKVIIDVAES